MKRWLIVSFCIFLSGLWPAFSQFDTDVLAEWHSGPSEAVLGDSLAVLRIAPDLLFADGDDTRKLLAFMEIYPTDSELGLVTLKGDVDENDCYLVLELRQTGFVDDKDWRFLDAQTILECSRRAEESQNKLRAEQGLQPQFVRQLYQAPQYDRFRNRLRWGLYVEDEQGKVTVRYHMIWLGRTGYIETMIYFLPGKEDDILPFLDKVFQNIYFLPGKRYEDYRAGDPRAPYSMVALIVGQEEAVFAKFGGLSPLGHFFYDFGIPIVLFIITIAIIVLRYRYSKKRYDRQKKVADKQGDLEGLEPAGKESRII